MQTPITQSHIFPRYGRQNKTKGPEPVEILEEMCDIFEESIEDVKGRKKPGNLIIIRQLYAYVSSLLTNANQKEISKVINRERTNVVYHITLVKNWLRNNDEAFNKNWLKYTSTSEIWRVYGAN